MNAAAGRPFVHSLDRALQPFQRHIVALFAGLLAVGGLTAMVQAEGFATSKYELGAGAVWVASSAHGQLALLDGASAQVIVRLRVAADNQDLVSEQGNGAGYAVNRSDGTVVRADGATWATSAATQLIANAIALQVVPTDGALYAVDGDHRLLAEADPTSLAIRGVVRTLSATVSPGELVATDEVVWMLDSATGDVLRVAEDVETTAESVSSADSGRLVVANGKPVAVDLEAAKAVSIDPDSGKASGEACVGSDGADDTVQIAGGTSTSTLYVISGRDGALRITDLESGACDRAIAGIALAGSRLGTPIEVDGNLFIPNASTGAVIVVDLESGRVTTTDELVTAAADFEMIGRDGFAFFNDRASERAGVIRSDGSVRVIPKYDPTDPGRDVRTPVESSQLAAPTDAVAPEQPEPTASAPTTTAEEPPATDPGSVFTDPPSQSADSAPDDSGEVEDKLAGAGAGAGSGQEQRQEQGEGSGETLGGGGGAGEGELGSEGDGAGEGEPGSEGDGDGDGEEPVLVELLVKLAGGGRGSVTDEAKVNCPDHRLPEHPLSGNGSCSDYFSPGSTVELKAKPTDDATVSWSVAGCGSDLSCPVSVNSAQTVIVTFSAAVPEPVELIVTLAGLAAGKVTDGGELKCPDMCSSDYRPGSTVTLTAEPLDGASVSWSVAGCNSDLTCQVSLNSPQTVIATFSPATPHWNPPDIGAITCTDPVAGTSISCSVVPVDNSPIDEWHWSAQSSDSIVTGTAAQFSFSLVRVQQYIVSVYVHGPGGGSDVETLVVQTRDVSVPIGTVTTSRTPGSGPDDEPKGSKVTVSVRGSDPESGIKRSWLSVVFSISNPCSKSVSTQVRSIESLSDAASVSFTPGTCLDTSPGAPYKSRLPLSASVKSITASVTNNSGLLWNYQ